MSPVLTQRVAGTSSGISRAVPNCQPQALRSGASGGSASCSSATAAVSSPAGRRAEQGFAPGTLPSGVSNARADGMDAVDAAGAAPSSSSSATATAQPPLQQLNTSVPTACIANHASDGSPFDRPQQSHSSEPMAVRPCYPAPSVQGYPTAAVAGAPVPVTVTFNPIALRAQHQEDSGLLESAGDIPADALGAATTFIPLMQAPAAPPSPTQSSAPCSPASSIMFSSAYRLTSSSGIDSSMACALTTNASAVSGASPSTGGAGGGAAGGDASCPLVNALLGPSEAFRQCFVADFGSPPSIQPRRPSLAPQPHQQQEQQLQASAAMHPQRHLKICNRHAAAAADVEAEEEEQEVAAAPPAIGGAAAAAAPLPPLSHFAAASASGCSSRRSSLRDQNSVTIKASTVVKDAAGAIDKILARGVTALVTALRPGGPPYNMAYDSMNQAVKAIAVARQYAKETGPEGAEVTFMPFHRNDSNERPDPCLFAFLVFPVPHLDEQLKTVDETVLNVARGSDVHKMASAIIAVMLDRGQAVMKAAGAEAIFVAMSAVVNARHRLVQKHGFDLMLAAAWITEDTSSTMGRESKFLRFNVLKTEPAGPKSGVAPALPALMEAC